MPTGVYTRVDPPIQARLTIPLPRYAGSFTIGHGYRKQLVHVDPVGSLCSILGWWEDGTVYVALPQGGYGNLNRSQLEFDERLRRFVGDFS